MQNKLFSIEFNQHNIDITKQEPFSLSVKLNFKDDNFKKYILDDDRNIKSLIVGNGLFSHCVIRYGYSDFFDNYFQVYDLIKGNTCTTVFKHQENLISFEKSMFKKINTLFYKYEKKFIKLKELATANN